MTSYKNVPVGLPEGLAHGTSRGLKLNALTRGEGYRRASVSESNSPKGRSADLFYEGDSQLMSGSADYGMNSNEEGGITVRGLWAIRNWAGVPTGNQWNHETKAQLVYDVQCRCHAATDQELGARSQMPLQTTVNSQQSTVNSPRAFTRNKD